MSERRMFAKSIIDSDAFLDMPLSTQALYFHLAMRADDEGFVNNPKKIQRMIGASDDDLKVLLAKNFIIAFESGVIVIKHWKIHNYIRGDRIVATNYQEEKAHLELKDNGSYTLCQSNVSQMSAACPSNVSIGKDSIGKDSIAENNIIYNVETKTQNEPKKEPFSEKIREVLDYLNQKTGKKYTGKSKAHQSYIIARLREGFTVDDFKKVIDNQVIAWGNDDKMKQYIRPETLFCGKFETYLNNVEDEQQKQRREDLQINERQRQSYDDETAHFFE